ncbi:MAG: hypothetical protein FJW96_14725 [Actinobacteria bacterium]|nr:hypothetical protein [Actinomycetota bacterium]
MARLYLHCAICDRKQADGLISGAAWGRVEMASQALAGATLRVCPTCIQRHDDWHDRVASALAPPGGSGHASP